MRSVMRQMLRRGVAGLALALTVPAVGATSLPDQMTWTAYGSSTSGYAQAIAIGNMLDNVEGTRLYVKPGKNDVSRMIPLKYGQAGYCMCGISSYFASEGVEMFATRQWGPQPIRMIMAKIDDTGTGIATRAGSGIETASDLAGKRIPWVRAGASLNVPIEAHLAFAGLTWDDVEKVTFSGFKSMWEAVINDQADIAFATTVTPLSARLASTGQGIHWIPLPHDNTEGWKRLKNVAPYLQKRIVSTASGLKEGESFEGAGYPYPILITTSSHSTDEVYALTKAMIENFGDYKDAAPGAEGWDIAVQDLDWVIPYHEGAVRYFKEIGVWSDDLEQHNQKLIDRQNTIIEAWQTFIKSAPDDEQAFHTAWMKARADALTEAGYKPYFE